MAAEPEPEKDVPFTNPLRDVTVLIAVVTAMVLVIPASLTVLQVFPWQRESIAEKAAYIGKQASPEQIALFSTNPQQLLAIGSKGEAPLTIMGGYEPLLLPFFERVLTVSDNLHHWQLCSSELAAEAYARTIPLVATSEYPYNLPLKETPEQQQLTRERVMREAQLGSLYQKVASSATAKAVACTSRYNADSARWLLFTTIVGGEQRELAISDAYLMREVGTVEWLATQKTCKNELVAQRDKTANTPVDAAVQKNHDPFSEQEKMRQLGVLDGRIRLLDDTNTLNC